MTENIWIYGAGGMGKETLWLVTDSGLKNIRVEGFIDDFKEQDFFCNLPIIKQLPPKHKCIIAIADPLIKKKISKTYLSSQFINIIHPDLRISSSNQIGIGNIFCIGVILTVDITIGNHVIINVNATIGHDCIISDYVSIMPGVHLSGNVNVGESTFIGLGANVLPNITIGSNCKIGAGAVVTHHIPDNSTAVGVPAKIIK